MESLPREVGRGAGTITSKGYGMMQAFQIMRSIIDSLQQEQPEVNYDDAVSQFVKIPYTGERWFSTTDGEFIAGALFEEPIPADAELYYKKEDGQ